MIYIRKASEPASFKQYRLTTGAHFDDLPGTVKAELRVALLREQGHLCAYCMKSISETSSIKIEHYDARNGQNELEYKNLLAACDGNTGSQYRAQTCDTRKGNQDLHINPQNQGDMDTIYYDSTGIIYSHNKHYDGELNGILNLNYEHGYLIENRLAALKPIKRRLHKLSQKADRKRLVEKLWAKYAVLSTSFTYPEYVGIIRWYLQKKKRQFSND